MLMKEPFMFEILILLFSINSVENYKTFTSEITISLKIVN